jgi:hypothetical protein
VKVHTSNSSTREAKEGGSQVQGQPGLYGDTLYQKEEGVLEIKNVTAKKVTTDIRNL